VLDVVCCVWCVVNAGCRIVWCVCIWLRVVFVVCVVLRGVCRMAHVVMMGVLGDVWYVVWSVYIVLYGG